ncbi:hypothetical protein [Deinococcus pimensis]|uniref:hypothetical protein n=1 Tax=Deinococcus pimensis TaxID=309888 RepID=UPI00048934A6|nr:hypothetical protein [Deinococcus pimensis]
MTNEQANTKTCPNDGAALIAAQLRQVKLVLQPTTAPLFSAAGSGLRLYTCPRCGLTQAYAEPPLRPDV